AWLLQNGTPCGLLPRSRRGRDCDGCQSRGVGLKYRKYPLDAASQSAILRSCSAHIPFTETSGGTHGKRAADTSGHTLRGRRRVSASGRATPAIRSRTAENLQIALLECRRPPRRNQIEEDEAPLQRSDGADRFAYHTQSFEL